MNLLDDKKYQIICSKNLEYNGIFFTAVKTTGIYCLPSCNAKNPLRENVEFFNTTDEVEIKGYRPCKKCYPKLINIDWVDKKNYVMLKPPKEFSFEECMVYLSRSDAESLHKVKNNELYKLIEIDKKLILFKLAEYDNNIKISFLNGTQPKWIRAYVVRYVWDWFDLDTSLSHFYKDAKDDRILKKLTEKYYGLRIIKIDGLFEALCWAIIGQQINLKFAYTLKKRLVERYGRVFKHENEEYWIFPSPEVIAVLKPSELREMQFTSRKAEYIVSLAKLMVSGELSIKKLKRIGDYEGIHKELLSIRGVGNWTADYVIMKCFNLGSAFPIADVGLHNALKNLLDLEDKPSIEDIEKMSLKWRGWESYATFYLWRSLYD